MATRGLNKVKKNIDSAFRRKRAAIFALSKFYAAEALSYFKAEQAQKIKGRWWVNQTNQAAARFFTSAFLDGDSVGFFIAHGVDYGTYLTIANDRKNDALIPIMRKFVPKFIEDVKKLYKG